MKIFLFLVAALAVITQLRTTAAQGVDCATVRCVTDAQCDRIPGYEVVTFLGDCCEACRRATPECDDVTTCRGNFLCSPGFVPVASEGCCGAGCERDCSTVRCAGPMCERLPGYEAVDVPGGCCQACRRAVPECNTTICTTSFFCETGFEPVPAAEGECCGTCALPNCAAVTCPGPELLDCEEPEVPEGECCAVCPPRPDCIGVLCFLPDCEEGFGREIPEGQCCPVCTDCSTVECPINVPLCAAGFELVTGGTCCFTQCQPVDTCKEISCLEPECELEDGFKLILPGDECCLVCQNCSAVTCPQLSCDLGFESVTPKDKCCPECQPIKDPDCSAVSCFLPECDEGFGREVPEGSCCPVCVDCSGEISCPLLRCAPGYELATPENECCPTCQQTKGCAAVTCLAASELDCEPGQIATVPFGECCPVCGPDCSAVGCFLPTCEEGFGAEVQEGACCPICTDCSTLECPTRLCADGFELVTADDACCPRCVPIDPCRGVTCDEPECEGEDMILSIPKDACCPICLDCSAVTCPRLVCIPGYELVTPKDQCCPECLKPVVDCSAVTCLKLVCEPGFELTTPVGECCSICTEIEDPCNLVDCAPIECEGEDLKLVVPAGECCQICQNTTCPEGLVYTDCASACPLRCGSDPFITCFALCRPGCVCPDADRSYLTDEGECVAFEDCPSDCPEGSRTTFCEPCTITCTQIATGEFRVCPAICRFGKYCTCDTERVVDEETGECVLIEDCPTINITGPCATSFCPRGSVCKVHEPTGEVFCDPSCDINNGGCPVDTLCRLLPFGCESEPCVPRVECVRPTGCAAVLCGPGHFCVVDEITGQGFCQGSCEVDNGGCLKGQECVLTPIKCLVPPCPPTEVECVGPDACANFSCGPGSRCLVFRTTGEPYCEPSCDIDNGGCDKDEECRLLDVPCASFPCIPVVECVNPCETFECPAGSVCKVFDGRPMFTLEPFCEFSCDLDNGGCRDDQVCRLETVFCFRPPCPARRVCLDPAEICNLDVNVGSCSREERAFFFNRETGECERFAYSGCGGNDNRFSSIRECRDACNLCVLPSEAGPCRGSIPSFFFNSATEQCESFFYGGCQGNANRFSSMADCEDVCGGGDCPPTCSKEFCDHNRGANAICSNPGPRQFPGCTGPCQLTYCSACYYSEETLPTPVVELPRRCQGIIDYTEDERCLFHWANEVRKAHRREHGAPLSKDPELLKCYNPDCPRRG